jgi:hypothetical protein
MPFLSSIRGNFSALGKSRGAKWRPVVASGGTESTITVNGIQFRVHRFTTTGSSNFIVSDAGTDRTVEALIVGAGGAGGYGHGGGGGGGAVLHRTNQTVVAGTTYPLSVGASGTATSNASNNQGGNSTGFGVTATGGGQGANEVSDDSSGRFGAGAAGANGGGGSYSSSPGGTGTAPTASGWTVFAGNAGGVGAPSGSPYGSGGGGGAGGIGIAATANQDDTTNARGSTAGGWGADGTPNDILGNNYFWAAGGGGVEYIEGGGTVAYGGAGGAGGGGGSSVFGSLGSNNPGVAGLGGLNAGGNGVNATDTPGGAGGTNTGSGGGAASNENADGGAGGSGFIAIRYPLQDPTGVYPVTTTPGTQAGKTAAAMTGGVEWFAQEQAYWGVEDGPNYKIPAGKLINRVTFREGNSVNNTAMWFVVFEKGSSAGQYYMIAAWRFTQTTAGNDSVLNADVINATSTRGTGVNNTWTCPFGATFGIGEYYVGWVSSDSRVAAKNGAIWVDATEGSITPGNGTISYVTVAAGTSAGLYPDQVAIGTVPAFPTSGAGYKVGGGMHIGFANV